MGTEENCCSPRRIGHSYMVTTTSPSYKSNCEMYNINSVLLKTLMNIIKNHKFIFENFVY